MGYEPCDMTQTVAVAWVGVDSQFGVVIRREPPQRDLEGVPDREAERKSGAGLDRS